ncbi:MAG: transposase, partial [Oscillochloris sp.]|nr:transposase [Oscillochloris sp.]
DLVSGALACRSSIASVSLALAQVEIVFKRLKSGFTRAALRGQTQASLEASILALLLAWVLHISEAAHQQARLTTLAHDAGWVLSSWG